MDTKQPNASERARETILDMLPPEGETINMPGLARALRALVLADHDWLADLTNRMLYPVCYGMVQQVVSATRGNYIVVGDEAMPRAEMQRRSRESGPPTLRRIAWETHMENIGIGRTLRLMDMTAPDLEAAARLRERSASTDLAYAQLWRALKDRMPDPSRRLGDVFTPEQIEAVRTEIGAGVDLLNKINAAD